MPVQDYGIVTAGCDSIFIATAIIYFYGKEVVVKKIILVTAGNVFLTIGIVGVFIPLLPTTPFLLLAAACFLRSSDHLYKWLTHHKLFGLYIRSYLKFRAISIKVKVFSIMLLWIVIGSTVIFF